MRHDFRRRTQSQRREGRRRFALGSVAATLGALACVTVGVAAASASFHGCPSGSACLWTAANYSGGGSPGGWDANSGALSQYPNGSCSTGSWNDCDKSLYNNGGGSYDACWVANAGPFAGSDYQNDPGTGASSLASGWQNVFGSLVWLPVSSGC